MRGTFKLRNSFRVSAGFEFDLTESDSQRCFGGLGVQKIPRSFFSGRIIAGFNLCTDQPLDRRGISCVLVDQRREDAYRLFVTAVLEKIATSRKRDLLRGARVERAPKQEDDYDNSQPSHQTCMGGPPWPPLLPNLNNLHRHNNRSMHNRRISSEGDHRDRPYKFQSHSSATSTPNPVKG